MAARANYLAADRPDIQYSVKEICRRMAKPVESDWKKLIRLARYIKGLVASGSTPGRRTATTLARQLAPAAEPRPWGTATVTGPETEKLARARAEVSSC